MFERRDVWELSEEDTLQKEGPGLPNQGYPGPSRDQSRSDYPYRSSSHVLSSRSARAAIGTKDEEMQAPRTSGQKLRVATP